MAFSIDAAAWGSPWRRIAVADKALLVTGTLVLDLLVPAWPGTLLVAAGLTIAAIASARVDWRLWLAALALPLTFVLTGVLSIALQVGPPAPGSTPWWSWGPLAVTAESVARAGTVLGRSLAGTCAVVLLAVSTPMVDLVDAGRRLGVPAPAMDIAALMYRLLFVLWESAVTIRSAQAARLGYVGLRRSVRSFGSLAAGVLVSAWDRSRRLEQGLSGRGYTDDLRTLRHVRPHSPVFLAATGAWLLALAAIGTYGSGVLG
ncbi:cobalt/nickel transport system permease protein [Raineyella antarctica]|uniref:Cobalt/nickel transport system permease protein n=1 Tax=Raineyella antarctica TaxID=1577474 RepID=A0A1G6GF03_9ACTN|nr:cobalt ECF transporter T component CbiQ [Raineyella antarctica]SDB80567.1 cobalt/nickel transport system permease protein [Raineyella antarctica]